MIGKTTTTQIDQEQSDKLATLVSILSETNLVALDKTLAAIRRVPKTGYMHAAGYTHRVAELATRAAKEVRLMGAFDAMS